MFVLKIHLFSADVAFCFTSKNIDLRTLQVSHFDFVTCPIGWSAKAISLNICNGLDWEAGIAVISLGCRNIVLYSSWWGSADGIVWLGVEWGGGSEGQLVCVPWRPIWSGSLQASVFARPTGRRTCSTGLLSYSEPGPGKNLHLRVDLALRFSRAPTELEEFPPLFLEMWKTETSHHQPPPNSTG